MSKGKVYVPRQRSERGGHKGGTLRTFRQRAANTDRQVEAFVLSTLPRETPEGGEK